MGVRRLVRLAAAGMWAWVAVAAHADTGCGAGDLSCETSGSQARPQSTALVVPHAGDFMRTGAQARSHTPLEAGRSASVDAPIGEPVVRSDSEAVAMAEHEIYALMGALLVAVLSLSRRRNL